MGWKKAYAMESGRELRVIVKSNQVRDNQVPIIARKIAKKIERERSVCGRSGRASGARKPFQNDRYAQAIIKPFSRTFSKCL